MACGETQLITFTYTPCCHRKLPFSRQLSSLRGCEFANNRREAPGLARRCPTTSSTRTTRKRTVGSRCDQSRWPSFPSSSTVKFDSFGSNKQRTRPSADTPVLKYTQRCSPAIRRILFETGHRSVNTTSGKRTLVVCALRFPTR